MILDQIRWRLRASKYRYRMRAEMNEIEFVCRHLKPGQTAVDIGAYKGAFTYWMRKHVGPCGKVFAFEPQPTLAKLLRSLTSRNPNITVEAMAVADQQGEALLTVPVEPGCETSQRAALPGHATVEPAGEVLQWIVRVTSLDEYFAEREARPIHFIKCDAEGHELQVFLGAQSILTRDRPTLLFEARTYDTQSAAQSLEVFRYLWDLDYTGHWFDRKNHTIRPIDSNPEDLPGPYSHNLAFVPRERPLK